VTVDDCDGVDDGDKEEGKRKKEKRLTSRSLPFSFSLFP
jgi:hypothetical protein